MPALNIDYNDENLRPMIKMINNIIFEIMCWSSQDERDRIKRRQAEGIAAAKARGVILGRPRLAMPSEFEANYIKWKNRRTDWYRNN